MSGPSEDDGPGSIATDEPQRTSAGPWDDPGRLIENHIRGRQFRDDDADTVLLAWLMTLDARTPPSAAARSAHARLSRLYPAEQRSAGTSLFRLLDDIARGRLPARVRW